MIIFLCGENTFGMKEKLREIIESYKKAGKTGINLKLYDCETDGDVFKSLKDSFSQVSMFKEKKLAVVKNPFAIVFKESFLKEKGFIDSEDILVLFQEGEVKKSDALFKYLEKNAKCQNFESLSGQKLKAWIQKRFLKYGARVSSDAENVLLDYAGNDLWRLDNEIQKLALYKKGRGVERDDVKLLVKPRIEAEIFKTIDALGGRDKKLALRLMHKHIAKGESPIYLLSMVNFQFRNLLAIKDLTEKGISYQKSGLHPFVARKAFYQSQKFSISELKKIYLMMFQADIDVKTGRMESESALESVILSC